MIKRRLWLCFGVVLLATACQPQPTASPPEVLRIAIARDVVSLDPTQVHQPSVDESLIRNLYNGLYKFDDSLKESPDLAKAMPAVSSDRKTWTFHIRPDAKFGNGDRVTADDVIFSWNRAAQVQSADAVVFAPVAGFDAVQSGKQSTLAGLSAPDQSTVVANLSAPAEYWFALLGLWPAYVLNRRVLQDYGDKDWWRTPKHLSDSATGPYQFSAWQPGMWLDFTPTPNWWGGGTGALTRVRAEILATASDILAAYEHGDVDIVGYAPDSRMPEIPLDALAHYLSDSKLKSQVHSRPWFETLWLRFYTRSGPLAGPDARMARKALSEAIDRKAFVGAACNGGLTCMAATGGMFLPGLQGYLGDDKDPNAQFDVSAAKADLRSWDPEGTKSRDLRMYAPHIYTALVEEVHRQWLANLGIDVPFDIVASVASPPVNRVIFGGVNTVDFDSPQNFLTEFFDSPSYSNPVFNELETTAEAQLPSQALPLYTRAEQILEDDVAVASLAYRLGIFLIKPSVVGAGGNALYEYYWRGISIKTD